MQDLFGREGADGLLPVPEGGIGHPDFFRHLHGHMPHIEGDLRHMGIIVDFAVKVGLLHILQGIVVLGLHEQVVGLVKLQHTAVSCSVIYSFRSAMKDSIRERPSSMRSVEIA